MNSDTNFTGIAMDDFSLHFYDIFNRRTVHQFDKCHGNRITDLGFRPGGLWLVSSSLDCTIEDWILASACLSQHKVPGHCPVRTTRHLPVVEQNRPGIALRQMPADYEPATVFQLPGASCIDEKESIESGDEVVEQHPMQQEVTEEDGETVVH
ncbi:WD repeat-containing protein 36 [Trichinella murrelli]|uniref:WD repeat-containing protein 36 n=1 Tax=Trichinella murrelli TaxID=144512 RepID=A0A0V0TGS0_9BILA|nr:WD repeat-containing protein 36 [Trichinella murrelli]